MKNVDIRNAAGSHGLKLWQIADALGMSDSVFSRKMRRELSDELKAQIFEIIDRLAQEV